jgi:hypothetical protein
MEKHRSRIAAVLYAFALVMVSSIVGAFADKVYAGVGYVSAPTATSACAIRGHARVSSRSTHYGGTITVAVVARSYLM